MSRLDALLARSAQVAQVDHVPEPTTVFYGVTPWVPAKDATYTRQNPDGSWQAPRPGVTRKASRADRSPYHPDHKVRCRHCLDEPFAAGQLCPGCHRDSRPGVEDRLALARERSRRYEAGGVRLERADPEPRAKARRPKAPTPAAVLATVALPDGVRAEATTPAQGTFAVVFVTDDGAHFTAARFRAERLHQAADLAVDIRAVADNFLVAARRPRPAQEVPCPAH